MSLGFELFLDLFKNSLHTAITPLTTKMEIDIASSLKYSPLNLCILFMTLSTFSNSSLFAYMSIVENFSIQLLIRSAIFARSSVFLRTRFLREET